MTLRHRLEYRAFLLGRAVWRLLPELWAQRVGAGVGWVAGAVLRVRRADVDEHLRTAFPDRDRAWRKRVALASYRHLGREAATLVRMVSWRSEEILRRVRFERFEMVDAEVDKGGGVVVLTAHLGNWEVAGAALAARGYPIDVVTKGMSNGRFEAELDRTRAALGMTVVPMADAPREVLRSLGRGRVVALLGDQNAHRGGVFMPFFGRPAATPRGPALFALRKDVPVFVGFAIRTGGTPATYTLQAHRLDFDRTGDVDTDVERLLAGYHRILEDAVRSAPDQYFWQHRRWKTRPPEEPGPGR